MNEAILVPLDGSPLAETALPAAVTLAATTGRDLHLLGVMVGPTWMTGLAWPQMGLLTQIPDQQIERSAYQEYLTGIAAGLAHAGPAIHTQVRQGDPAGEILAELAEQPALTTVALATHGRSGLQHIVLGSVAERILQAAPVPVLLVRGAPQRGRPTTGSWCR